VRDVERTDVSEPLSAPGLQLGVGVCGSDEVPADVGPAPQGVHAFEGGEGLVDSEEVRAQKQVPALGQGSGLHVDAKVAREHLGRARRVDQERDGVGADEGPQPPPVVRLAGHLFEHAPARLVHVEMSRTGVASPDGGVERGEKHGERLEAADERALGHVEPVVREGCDDPFEGATEHVLLDHEARQERSGEQPLGDYPRHHRGHEHAGHRAATRPPIGRPAMDDPHDTDLPVDLLGDLLTERDIWRAAVGADPVAFLNVVDPLDRLEPQIVAASVTGPARSLTAGASITALCGPCAAVPGVTAPRRFSRLLL